MHTIAIINQKGGVGKTTTTVNLAVALARAGQRVGVIDLDPQSHASLHLGADVQRDAPTTYELLTSDVSLGEVWRDTEEGVRLAPANLDLAAAEVELAGVVGRELILRDKLQSDAEVFDYVLVDCPPSLGVLTINALSAVRDVLLPLQPHFLALHGLSKLMKTVGLVQSRLNNQLRLAGVVLCMYESSAKLSAEISADVAEYIAKLREQGTIGKSAQLFEQRIRRNIRLAEAPSFGQSIFRYDPRCNGAEDYRRLADEVLAVYASVPRELIAA
jgi:chromosome partitioning protein